MNENKTIDILDSTLRDGAQGEGISFSIQDKIHIVEALDELGVKYRIRQFDGQNNQNKTA